MAHDIRRYHLIQKSFQTLTPRTREAGEKRSTPSNPDTEGLNSGFTKLNIHINSCVKTFYACTKKEIKYTNGVDEAPQDSHSARDNRARADTKTERHTYSGRFSGLLMASQTLSVTVSTRSTCSRSYTIRFSGISLDTRARCLSIGRVVGVRE